MIKTARIQKQLVQFDGVMEFEFPHNGHMAYADYDFTTGEYGISYHNGVMPAYLTQSFDSIEELAAKMKELSGDLRKWRKSTNEE
jgi:hypothetical protein